MDRTVANLIRGFIGLSICIASVNATEREILKFEPTSRAGDVNLFEVSSDGDYVVYFAGQIFPNQIDVFSKKTNLSAPSVQISPVLPPGHDANGSPLLISPMTNRVIFPHRPGSAPTALISMPIDGSSPAVKLGPELQGFSIDYLFPITSDGEYVAHSASAVSYAYFPYIGKSDGSQPALNLTPNFFHYSPIIRSQFTPDNSRFLYQQTTPYPSLNNEIYSSPIDASSPPVRINPTLQNDEWINGYKISADSSFILFTMDRDTKYRQELFKAPVDASAAAIKISPETLTGSITDFQISPDNKYAIYLGTHTPDTGRNIYSLDLDTLELRRLNDPLPSGGGVDRFVVSPDSSKVVFVGDLDVKDIRQLASADIMGATPAKNLSTNTLVGSTISEKVLIAPDSASVVFQADALTSGQLTLYSAAIDGSGPPAAISNLLIPGTTTVADKFYLNENGDRVVFVADKHSLETFELFSTDLFGATTPMKLHGDLPDGGDITTDFAEPKIVGNNVYYLADQVQNDLTELFKANVSVANSSEKINDELAPGADFFAPRYSPSGDWILFRGDLEKDGKTEFYRVRSDFSGEIEKINHEISDTTTLTLGFLLPDESYYIYATHDSLTDERKYFKKAFNNTSSETELIGLRNFLSINYFRWVPEVGRAYIIASEDNPRKNNLYVTTLAPNSTPVQINDDFLIDGDIVADFQFSDDFSYIVYHSAEWNGFTMNKLFRAPSNGSGTPLRLDQELYLRARFEDWKLLRSLHKVVFSSDKTGPTRFQIFEVPSDGSTVPTTVHIPRQEGETISGIFKISEDENWLYYSRNFLNDSVAKLYRVATSAMGVGTVLPGTESSFNWIFSNDGNYIYFQSSADRRKIFQLPVDGSSPPTAFQVASGSTSRVGRVFGQSPDSRYLIFDTDEGRDDNLKSLDVISGEIVKLNPDGVDALWNWSNFSYDYSKIVFSEKFTDRTYVAAINGSSPARRLDEGLPRDVTPSISVDDIHPSELKYVFATFDPIPGQDRLYQVSLADDSDNDGLSDELEVTLSTNPHSADSDGDGLTDLEELSANGNFREYSPGEDTDPNNPDTDGDEVEDGQEIADGTNPLDNTDFISISEIRVPVPLPALLLLAVSIAMLGNRQMSYQSRGRL